MLLTKKLLTKSQVNKTKNTVSLASIFIFSFSPISLATELHLSEPQSKNNESKQATDNTFSSFYYLGGKIGSNTYQDGCESWNISCEESDLGLGVFGGYQLNQYIAFETAYLKLGEAKATYLETGVEQTYIGSMQGFEFSVLASINLTDELAAFAKAGTFNWFGENKNDEAPHSSYSWAPTVGTGLSYQITKNWQARVEYQYFHELGNRTLGSSSSHLTTLGVSYRFGEEKLAPKKMKTKPQKKSIPPKAQPAPQIIPIATKPAKILPEHKLSVLFAFDDSKLLTPQALSSVVKQLTEHPQRKVILKGYTDAKGSTEYNLKLSEKRVNTIKQYLVTQGVEERQITSNYFGEASPLFDNLTAEHRNKNRRVLVFIPELTLNKSVNSNQAKQGAGQ